MEKLAPDTRPPYDPKCYLCPGNQRMGGDVNPSCDVTFVFTNDFSALLPDTPEAADAKDDLLRTEPARGECRVICLSTWHEFTPLTNGTAAIGSVAPIDMTDVQAVGYYSDLHGGEGYIGTYTAYFQAKAAPGPTSSGREQ